MQNLLRKSSRTSKGLVELMLECHERIRRFTRLAEEIAVRLDAPEQQIVEACREVSRYFTQALPLHIADEEESVLPRVSGGSRELEHALARMQEQHERHASMILSLVTLLAAIEEAPGEASLRLELGAVTAELTREFQDHLALEERVIFPAVAALSESVQAEIVAELRGRRVTATASARTPPMFK